ncbi:MAG: FlgT C-terminal domain-containing protein [Limosilactobacillus gorillae]|jgi:hypothetical protein|uniref:FlgT C-terminal domain-containing protein n=1 Tax=Limosilactobacillus gorillae TaxID=1450649 RepID=UPI000AB2A194|nr:FlgT C-terminal domain-containing protein [Limosilactobacillus gorillae]MDO4855397.1 FlgT C-terminal domain-containing protein [Limosilactobacillus gorillae]
MKEMKIAKIISTKQIVINAGSNYGLKVGDNLEIIDKFGDDPIIDPDTGESLGTLDIIKGTVVVSKVYAHMAIADSPKSSVISDLMQHDYLAPALYGNAIQKDLNVDPSQITGGFPEPSDQQIHIGDIVIKR